MKVVFLSNYYNQHQSSFSQEMDKLTNGSYYFIQTMEMEKERKELGWSEETDRFVLRSYIDQRHYEHCIKVINEADVVIFGSAPYSMIKERLKRKKLVFFYSERIYKKGVKRYTIPLRFIKYLFKYGRYKNAYLLCSSAYTAADYAKTRTFIGKTYKWGYFPQFKEYDVNYLLAAKDNNSLLWCSRFIELKHPEVPILIAEKLRNEGYIFKLRMIGTGPLLKEIKAMIDSKNLGEFVEILGPLKQSAVRTFMEKAKIFLFTSDFNEGWGAVLNESMNSGCVAIASHAIGAAPYLIQNGKNGYIYENGNIDDLYRIVKNALINTDQSCGIGQSAYLNMKNEWNAHVAASRLLKLAKSRIDGNEKEQFESGPCSKANILKDNWIQEVQND